MERMGKAFIVSSVRCTGYLLVAGLAAHGVTQSLLYIKKKYLRKRPKSCPALIKSKYGKQVKIATRVCLLAGEEIRKCAFEAKEISNKGDIDLVTETDKANEVMIMTAIKSAFPTHQFIGEESVAGGTIPPLTDAPTWIIDPIDGTTNFCHSYPFSCVSIGFTVNKIPTIGIIYDPYQDELFQAVEGEGAFLNGKAIHSSTANEFNQVLIIQEFGYERSVKGVSLMLKATEKLLGTGVAALRQCGSAAMDLCYVACGRADACYSGVSTEGWKPWDNCAGFVIAKEAGAVLTNFKGGDSDLYDKNLICAGNVPLNKKLVSLLEEFH